MPEAGDPDIKVVEEQFTDADQLGELYNGPHVRYLQTKGGPFRSQMRKVKLGQLLFHANHHTSSMIIEGENRHNLAVIGFQVGNSIPRMMVGELFTNEDIFLGGRGVEHLANVLPGQSTRQIVIPAEMLANEIAAQLNQDPVDFTGHRFHIRLGKNGVSELNRMVDQSFRIAHDLSDAAPSSPALEGLQKALVEKVADVLTAIEHDSFLESPSFCSTGWSLLQAREFFDENEANPISLGDVCRAMGVSKRTLQVAFAEGLGITPMRYLKLRRLNAVRQRLHATSASNLSISLAAREAGILDLSRFARDYKQLFGELPSQTRRA